MDYPPCTECPVLGYAVGAMPSSRRRAHSILNFLSLSAVRVARDERQEIVQRHCEITSGAALCIAVECAAVISEPGLFDR
jgi:hypothetical protein